MWTDMRGIYNIGDWVIGDWVIGWRLGDWRFIGDWRLSDRLSAMKVLRWLAMAFALLGVAVHAQAPRRVSLLVTGGIVVTVDDARHIYNPGAVAIDGRDIAGVGAAADVARRFR